MAPVRTAGVHMATDTDVDTVWDEFHTVVNMTSRELRDWLMTEAAGEGTEPLPDEAGSETGRHVLAVLGKRKTDLTEDDLATMRRVVDTVRAQRSPDMEPRAGRTEWRRRLMSLGHDPLPPTG